VEEAAYLFECNEKRDIELIKNAADTVRNNIAGNKVSYIINLNVNFTNICESICLFCGYRRSENDPDSFILNFDEFQDRLDSFVKDGISEVCLQGGLFSKIKIPGLKSTNVLDIYAELIEKIKSRYPEIHIHAYSPDEIEFVSLISGKKISYILEYFKDVGLDSMPGTAAEILDDGIRAIICPKKLNTAKWIEIIKLAHKLKIPTTSTIMFGHLESAFHRAKHLEILRNIQIETSGFTEFIPLPIVATKTLLSQKVTPLTGIDRLKMLAISRLFFKNLIPNIQASWVKQGIDETSESLDWGVNDVGGTLGDERITLEAGGNHGRMVSKEILIGLIKAKGKEPVLRDTLYNYIKEPVHS